MNESKIIIMFEQQKDFLLGCFIAITLVLIGGYYYVQDLYNFWNRKGLSGPKPWPIVGNLHALLVKNRAEVEKRWVEKYGKVYGIYYGSKPRLVVADLEVMKQICIKDFDSFVDHEVSEFFNKYQKAFIVFLKGDHWKKVRALMSPTFTSGKIKRMFKLLNGCADDLVDCAREQMKPDEGYGGGRCSAIINMREFYNLFTMDAIATCCYGLKLERETNFSAGNQSSSNNKTTANRNEFVKLAMSLFKFNYLRLFSVAVIYKPLLRFFNFEISTASNLEPFIDIVRKLIENRRKCAKKFDDYLQLLLETKLENKMEVNELDLAENHHAGLTQESILEDQKRIVEEVKLKNQRKVELSELEILVGASFLLLTGLETTGNLLTSCTYLLAFHQKEQEKLYNELMKIVQFKDEGKKSYLFDYESLTSCKYLDSVISETLRIRSPVIASDRVSNRDYRIDKYNIDLPKGLTVNLSLHAIMNDPDYWPEPDKFNPERFMPENRDNIVPGSYCPFGIGPRHCIGMRFSLTEAKLALAKIAIQFHFVPAPNTNYPPESTLVTGLIHCMKDPIVKYVSRQVN